MTDAGSADTDSPAAEAPTATADDVARLDAAFDGWVAAQQAAIEVVRTASEVPRTPVDVAEGYRWITRLAALAQDWFVEKADPLHPQLFLLQNEYRKLLVDNPDVRYLFATLDDSRTYRLTGTRGESAYLGLTFGTDFGAGAAAGGRTGTLTQAHIDEFELGPDGQVDVLIAPASAIPTPRPTNVVELVPGTGQLAVRETFFDKDHDRPSDLRLELVDPGSPPQLQPEELAPKLEFAGLFLQFVAATAMNMWRDAAPNHNSFGGTAGAHHVEAQEDEVRSHSNAEMTYHGGLWDLGEDEALVVTVHEPATPFLYWGLAITSPWMESYDYRYTTTHLNNRSAERAADGSWRLVIAPRDPGEPNWIDTGDRRRGYMIVRWVLADDPPHPSCEVVRLS
jgi:hypothetical protein